MSGYTAFLKENKDTYFRDLVELLRIQSISTDPDHNGDVHKAAEWVKNRVQKAGINNVSIMETEGHPVVFGHRIESEDKPTVLFYGHFDVQPAEPLNLWDHPPFEPHIQDGNLFARGASDMKANLLLPIIACEALLKTEGTLPVNVKFLFEGEEEIGSPSLGKFIETHTSLFTCDLVISADGGIGSPGKPKISLSTRGLAGLQIRIKTANVDLHSGMGGFAPNALHGLISILDALRDESGKVLVEDFYEGVDPIPEEDKRIIDKIGPATQKEMVKAGVKASFGESTFSPAERMVARPTLEINGMWGGYQGNGVKTVIPHEAFAKITCRLVGDQDPDKIRESVKRFISSIAPDYTEVTFEDLPGEAYPYRLPNDHFSVKTLKQVSENPMEFSFNGGTVPIMGLLKNKLGVETITIGATEAGQNAHAPNEFISVDNFYRLQGIYCEYLKQLNNVNNELKSVSEF